MKSRIQRFYLSGDMLSCDNAIYLLTQMRYNINSRHEVTYRAAYGISSAKHIYQIPQEFISLRSVPPDTALRQRF